MSCKLFCVFVLLGCVIYVQGLHYNLTTSERYAICGSPFTFTCQRDFHFFVINWFENNTIYRMSNVDGHGQCHFHNEHPEEYTFNCSNGISTVTIKSVKLSQHGTVWRCGDFNPGSNEIKMEVRGCPETSLKLNTSSVVTAVEGSDCCGSLVEDSDQFGKGFGSGFGTFFVLSVIIVIMVFLYFRYKRSNQTAAAAEHQDTENSYFSVEERRYEFTYNVLISDDNQTAPAAVQQHTEM